MSAVVEFVGDALEFVGDTVGKAVDFVVDTVEAIIEDPLPTLLAIAGNMVGIPVPITNAVVTAARGGSLEDVAKSYAVSYIAQEAGTHVAGAVGVPVNQVITNPTIANAVTNAITSGLINGTVSAVQGGDFGEGFTGGFVGSAVGSGAKEIIGKPTMDFAKSLGFSDDTSKVISRALTSSIGAGAGAAAVGGDFSAAFERGLINAGTDWAVTKASDAIKQTLKSQTSNKDAELKKQVEETQRINQEIQANAIAQQKAIDASNAAAMIVNGEREQLLKDIEAFDNDPNRTEEQRTELQSRIDEFSLKNNQANHYYEYQQEQIKALQDQQVDLMKQYEKTASGTEQTAEEFFIQEEKNAERIKQAYDINEKYKALTGEEITPEKLIELQNYTDVDDAIAKDLGFDSVDSMQGALTMKSLPTDVSPKLEAREGETAGQLVKETLEDGSVVYSRTFNGTTADGQPYSYKATYDEKNPRGVEYEVLSGVSQDYASGTPVDVVSGTERPSFAKPDTTGSGASGFPTKDDTSVTTQPTDNTGTTTEPKKTPADLQKDAANKYNDYVNASVLATQAPTPENIAAAENAKLELELAQKMADDAAGSVGTDIGLIDTGTTDTGATDTASTGSQGTGTGGVGGLNPDLGEVAEVKPNQTFPVSDTVGNNEVADVSILDKIVDSTKDVLGGVIKDSITGGLINAVTGGTGGTTAGNTTGGTKPTTGGTTVAGGTTGTPTGGTKPTTGTPVVTSGLSSVSTSRPAYIEAPHIMMTPQQIAERENFTLGRKIKRGGLASKRKK